MQRSDNLENRFKMGLGQGARCFFFVTHLFTVMYCAAPSYAPWYFDPKASTKFFYQTLLTAQCWKDSINIKWQIKSDPRTGNKGTTTQSVNKCSGLPTWKKKKKKTKQKIQTLKSLRAKSSWGRGGGSWRNRERVCGLRALWRQSICNRSRLAGSWLQTDPVAAPNPDVSVC